MAKSMSTFVRSCFAVSIVTAVLERELGGLLPGLAAEDPDVVDAAPRLAPAVSRSSTTRAISHIHCSTGRADAPRPSSWPEPDLTVVLEPVLARASFNYSVVREVSWRM